MIKQEYLLTRLDGVEIWKTYSDENKYIIQRETGLQLITAEDVFPIKYTYEEGEYINSVEELTNKEETIEETVNKIFNKPIEFESDTDEIN